MRTVFFSALLAFLLAAGSLLQVAPEGCGMDPSGRCGVGDPQPVIDEGCGMDPDGCPRGW